MEHEEKPLITFKDPEEVMIIDVRGNDETHFNKNSEVMSSQTPEYPYDDKGLIIQEKTRELIKTIQCYPSLYDPKHSHYRNNEENNKAWEAVAKQAKFSNVQEAQKEWKNVCDSYKKILRNQKDHPNQDFLGRRPCQWAYINEMKFMDNVFNKRTKKRSASSDSEHPGSTSSKEPYERQLKSVENTNNMIMDYLQKKMKDTEEKQDGLAIFFQSMESLVRTFAPARQLEVKCKLSAIILGAEAAEMKERLGMPEDNAVPVNFSNPGSSSNTFLNNMANMTYQNPNVYPSYSAQQYPPPQNYAPRMYSHQFAALQAKSVQFHQRMPRPNKQ